jgi:hypothetical protein
MKLPEYTNLIELLLNVVRLRPGMWLGQSHISQLPNFILGFMLRDNLAQGEKDFYFGDNGFLNWYNDKYKPQPMSFWKEYFLSEVNYDELKALHLYFEKLEEYYNWYKLNCE